MQGKRIIDLTARRDPNTPLVVPVINGNSTRTLPPTVLPRNNTAAMDQHNTHIQHITDLARQAQLRQLLGQMPPTYRSNCAFVFSMCSANEFTVTADGNTFSNDILNVIASVPSGKFDWFAKRFVFPLNVHDRLQVALQNLNHPVEPIPRNILAMAQLQNRDNTSNTDDAMLDLKGHVPDSIVFGLAPFQRQAVRFIIKKGGRALLADEMGLGKTRSAIAAASAYREEWPVLIVCPSSARHHWQAEIVTLLYPDFVMKSEIAVVESSNHILCKINGKKKKGTSPKKSEKAKAQLSKYKFVIVSYNMMSKVLEGLDPDAFKVVIVDECHFMKNSGAQRTKMLIPVLHQAIRVILVSGTPALSRPMELFTQLHAINPQQWPSKSEYGKRYCRDPKKDAKSRMIQQQKMEASTGNGASEYVLGKRSAQPFHGAKNTHELHLILTSSFMIRRRKKDVLTQLPPKQRRIVKVPIDDEELKLEMQFMLQMIVRYEKVLELLKVRSGGNTVFSARVIREAIALMNGQIELTKDQKKVKEKEKVVQQQKFEEQQLKPRFDKKDNFDQLETVDQTLKIRNGSGNQSQVNDSSSEKITQKQHEEDSAEQDLKEALDTIEREGQENGQNEPGQNISNHYPSIQTKEKTGTENNPRDEEVGNEPRDEENGNTVSDALAESEEEIVIPTAGVKRNKKFVLNDDDDENDDDDDDDEQKESSAVKESPEKNEYSTPPQKKRKSSKTSTQDSNKTSESSNLQKTNKDQEDSLADSPYFKNPTPEGNPSFIPAHSEVIDLLDSDSDYLQDTDEETPRTKLLGPGGTITSYFRAHPHDSSASSSPDQRNRTNDRINRITKKVSEPDDPRVAAIMNSIGSTSPLKGPTNKKACAPADVLINGKTLEDLRKDRKSLLMGLFGRSGRAKLPAILRQVQEFLDNKMSGKLLIFAHHHSVLDGVSDFLRSLRQNFIRIDGKTNSKERFNLTERFQTSSTCRVAVLSITAAGVAITLTAASTVFFAELFWTPGSMVQAEDRAHRIGQTTTVTVNYFLADDTVDDLLWPLLRKKMRVLGEFVEGMTNLDLKAKNSKKAGITPRAAPNTSSKDFSRTGDSQPEGNILGKRPSESDLDRDKRQKTGEEVDSKEVIDDDDDDDDVLIKDPELQEIVRELGRESLQEEVSAVAGDEAERLALAEQLEQDDQDELDHDSNEPCPLSQLYMHQQGRGRVQLSSPSTLTQMIASNYNSPNVPTGLQPPMLNISTGGSSVPFFSASNQLQMEQQRSADLKVRAEAVGMTGGAHLMQRLVQLQEAQRQQQMRALSQSQAQNLLPRQLQSHPPYPRPSQSQYGGYVPPLNNTGLMYNVQGVGSSSRPPMPLGRPAVRQQGVMINGRDVMDLDRSSSGSSGSHRGLTRAGELPRGGVVKTLMSDDDGDDDDEPELVTVPAQIISLLSDDEG